ncbi:hypothetical protein LCGC14_1173060 [marine sediment metagenome]|uniref:Uncharacterized protein n=1 Tax=marine sediment metagenome TaxID=412755 RepID=A0A0F9LPF5_9ZZZZ|nr:hypothetical protein [bacterium]
MNNIPSFLYYKIWNDEILNERLEKGDQLLLFRVSNIGNKKGLETFHESKLIDLFKSYKKHDLELLYKMKYGLSNF